MPNQPRPENRHRMVRVEDDLWREAGQVAAEKGTTRAAVMREALCQLVAEHERSDGELDPAYRDIEVCTCSTPGWTHHTGFHDFVADRVERAVKAARREGAADVTARVKKQADQWEFGVPEPQIQRRAVVEGLRAAIRDDA